MSKKKSRPNQKLDRKLATDSLYRKNVNLFGGLDVNKALTEKDVNYIIKRLHTDERYYKYTPEGWTDEDTRALIIRSYEVRGSKDLYERVLYSATHKMPEYTAQRMHDNLTQFLKEQGTDLDSIYKGNLTYREVIDPEYLSRNFDTQEAAELIQDMTDNILKQNYDYFTNELGKEGYGSSFAKREARNFISDYWFGSV